MGHLRRALLLACGAWLALAGTPARATPAPDLVIESIEHTPPNPARGDAVTFMVTVRNQGDAHADWINVGFWSDLAAEPLASDSPEQRKGIDQLPAGAAATVEFGLAPPLAEGSFTAWAYADPDDFFAESNESNNAGPSGGYAWSVTTSPEPDLLLESITLTPSNPVAGETATFTVTVSNVGGSAAGPFSVGLWLDRAAGFLISDTPEYALDVSGLAVGATTTLDFPVTEISAGRYWPYAFADCRDGTGEVAESNESNNTDSDWCEVVAPDAYEPDDTFAEANPISDGEVQIHSIHVPGDRDYVTFTLSDTASVTIREIVTDGYPLDDVLMSLYDSFQMWRASSDRYGELHADGLLPGTYYVMAEGGGFWAGVVAEYKLILTVSYADSYEADSYEPDDMFAQANTITDGETQIHSFHVSSDKDYVQFLLGETSDVLLETGGAGTGTSLYLYDSAETEIAHAYGWQSGGFSHIAAPGVPAGTYYAMVRGPTGDSYTLTLTVTRSEKPDLIIDSITLSPLNPSPGDTVTFTVTVKNRGGVDAGGFSVGFWLDWPETSAPEITDVPEQSADVSSLAAGASVELVFEATAPSMAYYNAWVYADNRDGTSEVVEFAEDNNARSLQWLAIQSDAYEPDDSFAEATIIAACETQKHSIHVVGDRDYLTFTLTSMTNVTIRAEMDPYFYAPVTIYLYDSAEALLSSSDYGRDLDAGTLVAGKYYVMIEESENDDLVGAYDLRLVLPECGDSYEQDDCFEQAKPIAAGETQTRSIHMSTDRDFVMFSLSRTSDVVIETGGSFSETEVYLYAPSLTQIAYCEKWWPIREFGLPAGTYYAMVRAGRWISSKTEPYTLSLAVTPAKPDLLVETIIWSPSAPAPGESVTFRVGVRNRGSVDAGAFEVGFWSDWSERRPLGITDVPEQSARVSGLSAAASMTLDFVATAPSAGRHVVNVYADRRNGTGEVAEFDEENNATWRPWGVFAPDAYEPDDTFAQARPISEGEAQTHSIHVRGDRDYVTFTLNSTADVAISATATGYWVSSRSFMRIYLFDASERLLTLFPAEADPMYAIGGSSTLTLPKLPAGTYYVMIEYCEPWPSGGIIPEYCLSFGIPAPDAYEPDDTFGQASAIAAGETQTRSIHVDDDRDYVEFQLSETSDVVLEAGSTAGHTVLYLYDSSQTEIASSSSYWYGPPARISEASLPAGTYCAVVEAYPYNGPIASYTLRLDATPSPPPQPVADDDWDYGCSPSAPIRAHGVAWLVLLAFAALVLKYRRPKAA